MDSNVILEGHRDGEIDAKDFNLDNAAAVPAPTLPVCKQSRTSHDAVSLVRS